VARTAKLDANKLMAAVDKQRPDKKVRNTIAKLVEVESVDKLFDYLDMMLADSPRPIASDTMLVALRAARAALPAGKRRTVKDIDLEDFIRDRGKPGILFHHGDLTIATTDVLPDMAVTGNVVVNGALLDSTSPSTIFAIAGNLTARRVAIAGTLVVGGNVTVDDALVTFGDRSNFPGGKPRPVRVEGALRAKLLVIGDHVVTVGGKQAVARTVELPRDVAKFVDDVRAFDNKKQINVGLLRSKVIDGQSFLVA
jgi:hypothetical protein